MATGETFSKYSDEIVEMHCEDCDKHGGEYKVAKGFCKECVDYLCNTCIGYHRRYWPEHTIVDEDAMPKEFCFERCQETGHGQRLVKFYCIFHDLFACLQCQDELHKNCKLDHIPSFVSENKADVDLLIKKQIGTIEELKKQAEQNERDLTLRIKEANADLQQKQAQMEEGKQKLLNRFKTKKEAKIEEFDALMEATIQRLQKEREILVKQLDEKQSTFNRLLASGLQAASGEMETLNSSNKASCQVLIGTTKEINCDLDKISLSLNSERKEGQMCKLFLKGKNAENDLKILGAKLRLLRKERTEIPVTKYQIEYPDFRIENLDVTKNLVKLYIKFPAAVFTGPLKMVNSQWCKEMKFVSLCLVTENCLIVTDNISSTIQCYETEKQELNYKFVYKFTDGPWQTARVTKDSVAITFPSEGILRTAVLSEEFTKLTVSNEIKTRHDCHGIAYSESYDRLVVTYLDPPEIQIMSVTGQVFQTLGCDDLSMPLHTPRYAAASWSGKSVYISDAKANTVFSMRMDGKDTDSTFIVKNVFQDSRQESPWGLTVDEKGEVIVCWKNPRQVIMLTPDLKKWHALVIKNKNFEQKTPFSVCCEKDGNLYLSRYKNDSLEVYKLEYIQESFV